MFFKRIIQGGILEGARLVPLVIVPRAIRIHGALAFDSSGPSKVTALALFQIDMVDVSDGDIITKASGTPAVQVDFSPKSPYITSAHALPSGAFPGFNASPPYRAPYLPVVFDFDMLATGDNILTIRIVAQDAVTTQDHSVTIRILP